MTGFGGEGVRLARTEDTCASEGGTGFVGRAGRLGCIMAGRRAGSGSLGSIEAMEAAARGGLETG